MRRMRQALSCGALVFGCLAGGCEDEVESGRELLDGGADAATPNEGGTNDAAQDASIDAESGGELGCQQADTRVWEELTAPQNLPAWTACASDQDCTAEFAPRVECAERNVVLSNCVVPIARAKLDAGLSFFRALETELCPSIQRGCRGGPSCAPSEVRCVSGQCRVVAPDGGTN